MLANELVIIIWGVFIAYFELKLNFKDNEI